ncbi:MAG: hypothetical protein A2W25_08765 [candidate division Zixibacteria bacterium RBG_16_53_22]|nr:MAG: hypothetical protein A2W25_08765 [candidate division Zixibacteria bacterium RBG_16_53_22]
MIFTSYTYVFFLMAAFLIHWSLPVAWRTPFLVAASYLFYCSWKWQYGFLLLGVSLFNWSYGRWVVSRRGSVFALFLGILVNLAPLIYFKYTLFLVSNAASVLNILSVTWHPRLSDIILPLGISFFTFQGIAYLVDVASGEQAFLDLRNFLLYKGFWPQLIAGPIIRPGEIRGQIEGERKLDYSGFSEGCRRILIGFFKKIVLADTLAPFVEMVYLPGAAPNAIDSAVGTLAFGLQIYFDFSAYSDIAIGTARLFGFVFPENFDWPYLSRSPREFWNRWHITLSYWIRDYVFTPMTFAARHRPKTVLFWLLLAMAICGLWHGAQWTFVLWGVWHGGLLVLNQTLLRKIFPVVGDSARGRNTFRGWIGTVVTFALVTLGWVFFRASSLDGAWEVLSSMFFLKGGLHRAVLRENAILVVLAMFLGLVTIQAGREMLPQWNGLLARLDPVKRILKPVAYVLLILAVIIFDKSAKAFVYFQF